MWIKHSTTTPELIKVRRIYITKHDNETAALYAEPDSPKQQPDVRISEVMSLKECEGLLDTITRSMVINGTNGIAVLK